MPLADFPTWRGQPRRVQGHRLEVVLAAAGERCTRTHTSVGLPRHRHHRLHHCHQGGSPLVAVAVEAVVGAQNLSALASRQDRSFCLS